MVQFHSTDCAKGGTYYEPVSITSRLPGTVALRRFRIGTRALTRGRSPEVG